MARRQENGNPDSSKSAVLKWIGVATAVISLVLGARQLITVAMDRAQRSRESAEFVALARQQAARNEFVEAWRSLDQAEDRSRTAASESARLDIGFRRFRSESATNQHQRAVTDETCDLFLRQNRQIELMADMIYRGREISFRIN